MVDERLERIMNSSEEVTYVLFFLANKCTGVLPFKYILQFYRTFQELHDMVSKTWKENCETFCTGLNSEKFSDLDHTLVIAILFLKRLSLLQELNNC